MKSVRKVFALLLCTAMAVTMFTACGTQQQNTPPASSLTPTTGDISSEEVTEPQPEPEVSEQTSYQTYEELLDVWTTLAPSNADNEAVQIFIQMPHYDGGNYGGALCSDQGDNTIAFVYPQDPWDPVSSTVQEVLPLNLEKAETVMETYMNLPGYKDGKMEITGQKDVTIHGYDMCCYEGTYSFAGREQSYGPYSFVSYAVKTKSHDIYVYWMIVDMTEDQSNSKLISENAEKMARTFYEAES